MVPALLLKFQELDIKVYIELKTSLKKESSIRKYLLSYPAHVNTLSPEWDLFSSVFI